MTQPYGQQPDPAGGYPQSGGYRRARGTRRLRATPRGRRAVTRSTAGRLQQGYPQSPPGGYPPAPGYGEGMPPAPPEYGQGPMRRPGAVTAAAVLAFVQAGITTIPAVMQLVGGRGRQRRRRWRDADGRGAGRRRSRLIAVPRC